ncbi:MAG TPA: hypothetical protein VEJ63_08330 [Planctomycetota bacterium]|nr:hypothetical protein [Planctomycetota bacterium]
MRLTAIPLMMLGFCVCAEQAMKAEKFLGPSTVAILKNATKVEVYRIGGKEESRHGKIVGEHIMYRGKDQDKDFAARIAKLLLDDRTYDFERKKECKPQPGVAFKIFSEDTSVTLALCFECDEFDLVTSRKTLHEDFDGNRKEFVKLAQEAFPDDEVIKALKAGKE